MKKYILPLLAASAAATPALALPTITFGPGPGIPSYTTAAIFESFEGQANGDFNPNTPHAAADVFIGQTESTSTPAAQVFSGDTPSVARDPDGANSTKFLSILGGTSYTVTFATPVQFFSFIIGSIDSYNNVKLVMSDGTVVGGSSGLFGQQIVAPLNPLTNMSTVTAGPTNSTVAGRVNYDFGGGVGLKSVIFSSTQNSLEIDGLAAAVPEAATWAMMMVGLGMVGGALRRRQKVSVRYAAA